jgi:hypothetical protein
MRTFIPNISSLFSLSVSTSPTSFLTLHCTQFHNSSFRWHNLEHSSATCEVTRKLRVVIGQLVLTTSRTLSTINSLLPHRMALKSLDTLVFNMLPLLSKWTLRHPVRTYKYTPQLANKEKWASEQIPKTGHSLHKFHRLWKTVTY